MPAVDTGTVLLIVAVAVEGALVVVLAALWLKGRRTQRLLRAKLAAALDGGGRRRPPKRLVPTPDEFVKGVWETANLVREKGFGGAIRTSIEDLAGWAQVERPALMSPGRSGRQRGHPVLRHRGLDRAQRAAR